MILSHRHRFIFLKTTKTAGTSVEISLSRFCGPDDIITPITPADEASRLATGGRGPQNHIGSGTVDDPDFFNHMSGELVRDLVGEAVWGSYFKFCIERNPWDRVVSYYFFRNRNRKEPPIPISRYIENPGVVDLQVRGSGIYMIDGEVAVDRIVRYEMLVDELEEIRKQLGIPEPLDLPWAKSSFRPPDATYRRVLSEIDIARIGQLFSREIELLGYQP
jgi:hypothetical protein